MNKSQSLIYKIKTLHDHPSTHPNIKAIASSKIAKVVPSYNYDQIDHHHDLLIHHGFQHVKSTVDQKHLYKKGKNTFVQLKGWDKNDADRWTLQYHKNGEVHQSHGMLADTLHDHINNIKFLINKN